MFNCLKTSVKMASNHSCIDSEIASITDNNVVPCPVCDRKFRNDEIEKHVNKCIFLNTASESINKRNSSYINADSPSLKKVKFENTFSKNLLSNTEESFKQEPKMAESMVLNNKNTNIPLSELMRPSNLEDIMGQLSSFGPGSMLHSMLAKKKITNMILWGPPGCGKTSIANVIANICKQEKNMRYVKMSATMSGISDVKEVVKVAKNEAQFKRQTVLFMDEIHRFNKLQQDTFLPHVENGTITLIGATTENPSFSLNNALLSRCRVVVLSKLEVDDIFHILEKAVVRNNLAVIVDKIDSEDNQSSNSSKCVLERQSLRWLSEVCDGDARAALGALELALAAASRGLLTLDHLKNGIKRSHMLYDRHGDEHFNVVSAVHKSIRASDDNAALYWTARALQGGEDPLYLARRLVRAASEDIGLADPSCAVEAVACLQGCAQLGAPECDVLLAQCAVRLARARKCGAVYAALRRAQRSLAAGPLPPVPLHLRNAPTKLMQDLGYGKGYNTLHCEESGLTYMPAGLENVNFFKENDSGG